MTEYERLVAIGIDPECARDTVCWYRFQGDDAGLERYVQEAEARHGVQVLQPKPV